MRASTLFVHARRMPFSPFPHVLPGYWAHRPGFDWQLPHTRVSFVAHFFLSFFSMHRELDVILSIRLEGVEKNTSVGVQSTEAAFRCNYALKFWVEL